MNRTSCPHCADKHYCFTPDPRPAFNAAHLEPFIQAQCLTGDNRSIQALKLYRAYWAWETQGGGTPIGLRAFGRTIRALGYPALKASVTYYQGISLTPQAYEYASSHLW